MNDSSDARMAMSGSRQSDTARCTSDEGVRSTSTRVLRMLRICTDKALA